MNIEKYCFGFVGLGLIGGSIAKTIRRLSPRARIIAYNRTPSVLAAAHAEGTVDAACSDVDERFAECDYIFLCLPVSHNIQYLSRLSHIIKKECILTDVGSVKTDIHEQVSALGLEKCFIGGHPMAGSEKTGYEHSTDHLLTNAYYIITPTAQSTENAVHNYYELVRQLGAVPLILGYKEHDYMTANISHVPHVIAASLASLVKHSDNEQQTMKAIAAGGFRDTTRIASSSPVIWQQICLSNSENICRVLDSYIDILKQARTIVAARSPKELYHFFEEAQLYRKGFEPAGNDSQNKEPI